MLTNMVFAEELILGDVIVLDDESRVTVERCSVDASVKLIVRASDGLQKVISRNKSDVVTVELRLRRRFLAHVVNGDYISVPCRGSECTVTPDAHEGEHQGVVISKKPIGDRRYMVTTATFCVATQRDTVIDVDEHRYK